MTLLELILALGLSVVVLGAVTSAIHLFLRSLDGRRAEVEETQIARAVLRMIADDLRSAVQQEPLDFGSAGKGASQIAANTADSAAGAISDATGGAVNAEDVAAAAGDSSGGAGGETTEGANQNIEESTTPPATPGLFGNQYELQVDVSRLPRLDELYIRQLSADGQSVTDLPSDIKTVAYYVRVQEADVGTGFSAAAAGSALGREMRKPGLVRRQLDRAVTAYASQNGRSTDIARREQLVAPEIVGVEFRYFDGSQWLTEWDSVVQCGLPRAIEIVVALQPGGEQFANAASGPGGSGSGAVEPLLFRQVVRLPAARPMPAASTTTTESSSDSTSESTPPADGGASPPPSSGGGSGGGGGGGGGVGLPSGGGAGGGRGGAGGGRPPGATGGFQ